MLHFNCLDYYVSCSKSVHHIQVLRLTPCLQSRLLSVYLSFNLYLSYHFYLCL
nr:MAG TPA: hypothetical protein [Caudoviricetes sp.]